MMVNGHHSVSYQGQESFLRVRQDGLLHTNTYTTAIYRCYIIACYNVGPPPPQPPTPI